jgi:hypothetical protein
MKIVARAGGNQKLLFGGNWHQSAGTLLNRDEVRECWIGWNPSSQTRAVTISVSDYVRATAVGVVFVMIRKDVRLVGQPTVPRHVENAGPAYVKQYPAGKQIFLLRLWNAGFKWREAGHCSADHAAGCSSDSTRAEERAIGK